MDFSKMFGICFSPEDGGGEDKKPTEAELKAGADKATADKKAQDEIGRREFLKRSKTRTEIEELQEENTAVKEQLVSFEAKIAQLTEKLEKDTGGRPKKEDTKMQDQIEQLTALVSSVGDKMTSEMATMRTDIENDRTMQNRKGILTDVLKATPEFVRDVDDGIINIPEHIWNDYDKLNSLVERLDVRRNGSTTAAGTTTGTNLAADTSVPHKDADTDQKGVQMDTTQKAGVSEVISAAEKVIDETLKDKPMTKENLTSLFDAAEKIDDAVSSR